MLATYVTADDPYATVETQLPAVLRANFSGATQNDNILDRTCYSFLWCATARTIVSSNATDSARSTLTPYMVGLRENIEIQINSGTPWQWRRICFRTKRNMTAALGAADSGDFYTPLSDGSARRTVAQLSGNRNAGQQYALFELIFQGQNSSDWVDPMVAKTDSVRLTVVYDKVRTISSGNEQGVIRKFKKWHPMHKTLVYNGDEISGNVLSGDFSTQDPPGMGDYYVLDLFRARYGAAASNVLTFSPQATLYWHEK